MQCRCFALAIANLPRNGKRLLLVVDRLLVLAQIVVSIAQIAEGNGLTLAIVNFPRNGKILLLVVDRLLLLA
jgi:hypothetical protein